MPKRVPTDPLSDAAAALPQDPGTALPSMISAWRAHKLPELGVLTARVSALAAADRPAITATNREEAKAVWLKIEKAKDPLDLDRLLGSLTACVCADAKVRLARLAARPED